MKAHAVSKLAVRAETLKAIKVSIGTDTAALAAQ
jgi:hypothetical protein